MTTREPQEVYTVEQVKQAQCVLEPLVCKYCSSHEVTYHKYIGDGYCAECGRWQR